MKSIDLDDEDEPSFFKRNLVMILAGVFVLVGAGYAASLFKPSKSVPKKILEVSIVMPPVTPSVVTPPPTPKVEPAPVEVEQKKMIVQEPDPTPSKSESKQPDKAVDEAPLSTAIGGGLESGLAFGPKSGGSNVIGAIKNTGGSTRWGWYASAVQNRVSEALRGNSITKKASTVITVKIWPDPTGRINKAVLAGTSGDNAVDDAIKNQMLLGLVLDEPPPAEMPLPINLRITTHHAN